MYAPGHWGAALVTYAPLGVAVSLAGHESLAAAGLLACVALSTLPDCDHHLPRCSHRGWTHTLGFALLVGAFLGVAAALATPATPPALEGPVVPFAFLVGTLSVGSHLLADVVTPMGIRPFRPISSRHYTLELTTAANPRANRLLLLAGVTATAVAASLVLVVE